MATWTPETKNTTTWEDQIKTNAIDVGTATGLLIPPTYSEGRDLTTWDFQNKELTS